MAGSRAFTGRDCRPRKPQVGGGGVAERNAARCRCCLHESRPRDMGAEGTVTKRCALYVRATNAPASGVSQVRARQRARRIIRIIRIIRIAPRAYLARRRLLVMLLVLCSRAYVVFGAPSFGLLSLAIVQRALSFFKPARTCASSLAPLSPRAQCSRRCVCELVH